MPHKVKSSQEALEPLGQPEGLGAALPETSVQAVLGLLTQREVRGWTELSTTWPLLLPAV